MMRLGRLLRISATVAGAAQSRARLAEIGLQAGAAAPPAALSSTQRRQRGLASHSTPNINDVQVVGDLVSQIERCRTLGSAGGKMSQQQLTSMLSHLYSHMTDEVILAFEAQQATSVLVQDLIGPGAAVVFDATLRCIGSTVLGELLRRAAQLGIPDSAIPHSLGVLREHGIPSAASAFHVAAREGELHLMAAALYACSMLMGLEAKNPHSPLWEAAKEVQLGSLGVHAVDAALDALVPLLLKDPAAEGGLSALFPGASPPSWQTALNAAGSFDVVADRDSNVYTLRPATVPLGLLSEGIWDAEQYSAAVSAEGGNTAVAADWLKLLAGGVNVLFAMSTQPQLRQDLAAAGAIPAVTRLAALGRHPAACPTTGPVQPQVEAWWSAVPAEVAQELGTSMRLAPTLLALLAESDADGEARRLLREEGAFRTLQHVGGVAGGTMGGPSVPARMLDTQLATTVASAFSAVARLALRELPEGVVSVAPLTPEVQAHAEEVFASFDLTPDSPHTLAALVPTLVASTSPYSHAAAASLLSEAMQVAWIQHSVQDTSPVPAWAHEASTQWTAGLAALQRLLRPAAAQVAPVSMACAAAALHDIARLCSIWLQAHAAHKHLVVALPDFSQDTILAQYQSTLQGSQALQAQWGDVPLVLQLVSDEVLERVLDVSGAAGHAGAAAAASAAARMLMQLRAQFAAAAGQAPTRHVPWTAAEHSAMLAVYLSAGIEPSAWCQSSVHDPTDVFAALETEDLEQVGRRGAGGVQLPLAMSAHAFTRWVPDVGDGSEDAVSAEALGPVGGKLRRDAAGAQGKVTALQKAAGAPPTSTLQPRDTSYEAVSAALALAHNSPDDVMHAGAGMALFAALHGADPLQALAAGRTLHQLAQRDAAVLATLPPLPAPPLDADPRLVWYLKQLQATM